MLLDAILRQEKRPPLIRNGLFPRDLQEISRVFLPGYLQWKRLVLGFFQRQIRLLESRNVVPDRCLLWQIQGQRSSWAKRDGLDSAARCELLALVSNPFMGAGVGAKNVSHGEHRGFKEAVLFVKALRVGIQAVGEQSDALEVFLARIFYGVVE